MAGDFLTAPTAVPQVKAGRIRGLAVTTAGRSVILPELPTIAEAGLPGFESYTDYALYAPAGTPASIVATVTGWLQCLPQFFDLTMPMVLPPCAPRWKAAYAT